MPIPEFTIYVCPYCGRTKRQGWSAVSIPNLVCGPHDDGSYAYMIEVFSSAQARIRANDAPSSHSD